MLCYAGLAYLPVCGTSSEMSGGAAGISKGKQLNKPCSRPLTCNFTKVETIGKHSAVN